PAPWLYVATAQAYDDEMRARIAEHRARRGEGWQAVDAPVDLAGAIAGAPAGMPILVDCLTLWLTNLLLAEADIVAARAALAAACRQAKG
ncbi:bifunctional adenosylcobinamide kinase/adenosylcobinamide-phosphate guanylyltransferase, partial [Escherichia coli]|uniref:bifunctional adenosylcobinamide kinase/adenosylcobinamide-phosphate guanylyltransferase n=1 Tax=Escherichia coli TaxID=562 RepID=UPI00195459EA